jgi:aspartate-semialdehyde dehydrogenase
MRAPPRIAVIGASSLIGEALIEELRARKFAFAQLHALDDERNIGRPIGEGRAALPVSDVAGFDFSRVDLAFFCARSALAQRHAEEAAAHAWVIDGSGAFRARPDVPLVAADVNAGLLRHRGGSHGLIALPGSASVALATVLAPLHALAGLARVEVATYQAVSGRGRAGVEELAAQSAALLGGRARDSRGLAAQIAFNVIPQVDELEPGGVSREERRLLEETRRVLALPNLALNATAVRVPVFFGHSFVVHASFERSLTVADATGMLHRSSGLNVFDGAMPTRFPTPAGEAAAADRIHVGRLRPDLTRDRSLNFWIVADNVRKCAALNAVTVAEILVNGSQ